MALSNAERQARYRERMEEEGYRNIKIWVSESTLEDRRNFYEGMESLTRGFGKKRLVELLRKLAKIVESECKK